MFGYVTINKPELKMREYERYHSFYCGLCHTLKERYGRLGQLTLTYDMTFLVILLSSLYEPETPATRSRCLAHPSRTHIERQNQITEYCADMNIALTYHKLMDDWKDDKSLKGFSGTRLLHRHYKAIHRQYPDTCTKIEQYLYQLSLMEAGQVQDVDKTANCFGKLMGCLFDYRHDIWSPYLKQFGFYLGKYIYLMDAYLDLKEDKEKGRYNPLMKLSQSMNEQSVDATCRSLLELMIGRACHEFEKLPLEQDIELMRNILYAGVWKNYDLAMQQKQRKETQPHE